MNSWAVSACYPQSTFYPLSDGPSIQNHRITMTCFRICPSCRSRSQAGFCHCTDLTVSDRNQPTFVLLRYSLGGDRPSQTSRQTLSRIAKCRLEPQNYQGGISRPAPPGLAPRLQSLPPILHKQVQGSVSSCSKGSRGLSVWPRVHCIFTAFSVSLSPGWRQRSYGYTIRAGRNLPDKEFRYLRTVIVTAAVYRGFTRKLRLRSLLHLTFRHRAGVTPYTSPLRLAECCVFVKQSQLPFLCGQQKRKELTFLPPPAYLFPKLRYNFA